MKFVVSVHRNLMLLVLTSGGEEEGRTELRIRDTLNCKEDNTLFNFTNVRKFILRFLS
jgi:hypothetical protein